MIVLDFHVDFFSFFYGAMLFIVWARLDLLGNLEATTSMSRN